MRLGDVEQVEQSRSKGLGLRVFFGQRSASTSTSVLDREALTDLIARTCAAAKVTAEDPHAGLAEASAAAVDFNSGFVWADGLRNEVGLAFGEPSPTP